MPSRNSRKEYVPETMYHVYNRGHNKDKIFLDDNDYAVFLNLLKRYLSKTVVTDEKGRPYEQLRDEVELVAFCLMPNHFHLELYLLQDRGIARLMQGVCAAYTIYFNKKYNRIGPLFQGRFKASAVLNDAYWLHLSRYIHRNPKAYRSWEWSSLQYYLGSKKAEWVTVERVLKEFDDRDEYLNFVRDDQNDLDNSSLLLADA